MKKQIFFLLFICSFCVYAQDEIDSIYFPQELLIHPDCNDSSNANDCLKNTIEEELLEVLKKAIVKKEIKKDTLTVSVNLVVDKSGKYIENKTAISISDKALKKDLSRPFDKILKKLPEFKIHNKKPDKYFVQHMLYFTYLVQKTNSIQELILIDKEKNSYTGGRILENPLFPGCDRADEFSSRKCFNIKMQEHLARNFNYPKKAQAKKIQGRVSVIFDIDKKGNVTNIRTKAPHKLLDQEARRIINLLPKFEPGLSNGTPDKASYSIPITFKLI